ncbi:hypothetical protein ACHAWF_011520, partial [Thalassiosira exigua]
TASPTARPTPRPTLEEEETASPTAPPTPNPTLEEGETASPAASPTATLTESPTMKDPIMGTLAPIAGPMLPPDLTSDPTRSPVAGTTLAPSPPPIEGSTSRPTDAPATMAPTPSGMTPQPPDTPTTSAPTPAPMEGATSRPTDTPTTTAPTPSGMTSRPTGSPVAGATPQPTDAPTTYVPTPAPMEGATSRPTNAPTTTAPTPSGVTGAPTQGPTLEATDGDTATTAPTAGVPGTFSPTALPPDAAYFNGFEKGSLDVYPEWSSTGDGEWIVTSEEAASGIYSVRSPDLDNDDATPSSSNLTLTTDADWGGGTLLFDFYGGAVIPFDVVNFYVDGEPRGGGQAVEGMTGFQQQNLTLGPGGRVVTFEYKYNPLNFPASGLPPDAAFPDRTHVFIDNVYFVPGGGGETLPPTPAAPDGPTTTSPTSVPDNAEYFNSFETGSLSEYPEWVSTGDGAWLVTDERANTGVFSVHSPDLSSADREYKMANLTFTTNDDWGGGILHYSVVAGTNMPTDRVTIFVDGEPRDGGVNEQGETEFEDQTLVLQPGQHTVEWMYEYNPEELPAGGLPPEEQSGSVGYFLDDVYFVPHSGADTPAPTPADGGAPDGPTTISPTSTPDGADYFNSFEKGDLSLYPEWISTGDGEWIVTDERANTGVFSAHTPDLFSTDREYRVANLTFATNPDWGGGTLYYSVVPGTNMPTDRVTLFVDGEPRGGGANEQGKTEFEDQSVVLGPGGHRVEWMYEYNPEELPAGGLPPDEQSGSVGYFLDDVYFVPHSGADTFVPTPANGGAPDGPTTISPTSTPDGADYFTSFEKGSLMNYPAWLSTGDGDWIISDERANTGVFSAQSPDLSNADREYRVANLTFVTNPDWGSGSLYFSVLPGTNMPIDRVTYFVDGVVRGGGAGDQDKTEFEDQVIVLGPGGHRVEWMYEYNPEDLPAGQLPPDEQSGSLGYFLDDVYFVPVSGPPPDSDTTPPPPDSGTTPPPPDSGTTPPPPDNGDCVPLSEEDFEDGAFPLPPWSTGGDGDWLVTDENSQSGTYSLRSPDLEGSPAAAFSNATLELCDNFPGGELRLWIYAPVRPPHDIFAIYVDGVEAAQLVDVDEWTQVPPEVMSPGPHIIDFRYGYNQFNIPLPPSPPQREGKCSVLGIIAWCHIR